MFPHMVACTYFPLIAERFPATRRQSTEINREEVDGRRYRGAWSVEAFVQHWVDHTGVSGAQGEGENKTFSSGLLREYKLAGHGYGLNGANVVEVIQKFGNDFVKACGNTCGGCRHGMDALTPETIRWNSTMTILGLHSHPVLFP